VPPSRVPQACEQPIDGLAHQRGPARVRRSRQLIQLSQLTFPYMQADGYEGIILASLCPRASSPIDFWNTHLGSL
jgi:hypothetical protein